MIFRDARYLSLADRDRRILCGEYGNRIPILLILENLMFKSAPHCLYPSSFLSASVHLVFSSRRLLLNSESTALRCFCIFLIDIRMLVFQLLHLVFPNRSTSGRIIGNTVTVRNVLSALPCSPAPAVPQKEH